MTRARPDGMRFTFPDGELEAWAAIGDVTDHSVRVWLRAPGVTRERASLRIGDDVTAEADIELDPEHDFVGAVVLEGEAHPGADFVLEVAGMERRGTLAPAVGAPAAFRFAFGSCHQPFEQAFLGDELHPHDGAAIYPLMRDRLLRDDARFLLLIGDQVYADGVSAASVRERLDEDGVTDAELIDIYRHLYRGYFNQAGFRALQESLPTYMTWDDHDIFDGWGSQLDPQEFDRRLYRAAETAYREYQHLRNPGAKLADGPPFAYSFWYGDVGFLVLDLRGCRDHGAGRVLGEEQWRAVDGFLRDADARDARTVFLAASVPIVHLSPGLVALASWIPGSKGTDVRDRWNTPAFRDEREALLERIFTWQAARPRRQLVALGGDVHVGAAFTVRPRRRTSWPRGRFHQWTSSALTTPGGLQHRIVNSIGTRLVNVGEPSVVSRRRGLDGFNNFGAVAVVPLDGGGHRLVFTLHEYEPGATRLGAPFRVLAMPRG